MSGPELNPVIHAPLRLQICAILSAVDEAEFALVREETGVSESVLSKHVSGADRIRQSYARPDGAGREIGRRDHSSVMPAD
jgi:hypothetical protein